ncbi:MAG: radical SAM family heme chaperone HemW [Bacilli bacterium]
MVHAVYIHIPFCRNKCHYCDFNTYVLKGQPVEDYLEALGREMVLTFSTVPTDDVKTIFVGGGTPTALTPSQMGKFLAMVQRYVKPWSPHIEFTMEANPGSTDIEKLRVMKDGGVNRLSFGVQTFDPVLLKAIGRIHTVDEVYESIHLAREVGFSNISIDLIFGLPNQTLNHIKHSLGKSFELGLQHFSIYGLKIEENTPFHTLYEKNQLPLPHEDEELAMYELIMKQMEEHGYSQYEISNFAKKDFDSKHNTTYWRNEDYYGFGAGAHGYLNGERHVNLKGINEYIDGSKVDRLPRLDSFNVDQSVSMEDFMMVGLRLLQGINDQRFQERYQKSFFDVFAIPIQDNVDKGLLVRVGDTLKLSKKGILFGNDVFASFIS